MSNNNWHVPLNKFSDEQRAIIDRVYRPNCDQNTLVSDEDGVMFYEGFKTGEEITADEAFEILGLDKLLEPEQGLQGVGWPDGIKYIVQDVVTKVISFRKQYPSVNYRILATRPKPKVKPLTDEQIEAVREFVEYHPKMANGHVVDAWLKEREQTGGEL